MSFQTPLPLCFCLPIARLYKLMPALLSYPPCYYGCPTLAPPNRRHLSSSNPPPPPPLLSGTLQRAPESTAGRRTAPSLQPSCSSASIQPPCSPSPQCSCLGQLHSSRPIRCCPPLQPARRPSSVSTAARQPHVSGSPTIRCSSTTIRCCSTAIRSRCCSPAATATYASAAWQGWLSDAPGRCRRLWPRRGNCGGNVTRQTGI